VLVRLHSPANIAAGDTVWGLGPHLAAELDAQLPGHTCMAAHDLDELDAVLLAHPDRALVVQGRDLARVPFLAAAVDVVRRSRPDALLVELGWPDDTSSEPADIATYGSGRGTMLALIELLALGTR